MLKIGSFSLHGWSWFATIVQSEGDGIQLDEEPLQHEDGIYTTQEVSNWYWIINPLWVQLAKQINKLDDILRHVQQRDYVFIPTLHSTRWVRWMKMRNSQTSLDE